MPTKRIKTFTAWSYSRLTDWEACPKRAALKHLEKVPEPKGPALDRGAAIHKEAEHFALGKLKKIPDSLMRFRQEFMSLRKRARILNVEQQLALTQAWQPCDWFGADAWLRAVVDCAYTTKEGVHEIIDYKTGQIHPEAVDQLDLYALVAFAVADHVRVNATFWYLDQGEIIGRSYTPADGVRLRTTWLKRVKPLLADHTFKARPGGACRWCWFGQGGKTRGGPGLCQF